MLYKFEKNNKIIYVDGKDKFDAIQKYSIFYGNDLKDTIIIEEKQKEEYDKLSITAK